METSIKSNIKNTEVNENEKSSKEENKVNMEGFRFFANTCEEKLKVFLENFFCNKSREELHYVEEKQDKLNHGTAYDNSSSSKNNSNSFLDSNDICADNDSSKENEDNNFEKNKLSKSNYDKIAINLADEVEQFMKSFVNERYKIVVQAIIGENKKQGVHIASKSLWNVETDNYISAKYINDFIFVTIMVFLLYNE
ncbi:dynein light chain type 2, putative [Plasmodium malariae]|uniref:Dynein light chain type 2, putative n=1 Tax=Plasmodium malariae TaxID=5858 RepID=A0A1D3PC06_PLAMA|nr:dynein light chain type 2, putative [Plasmodium malariae]SCN12661.1 dynein light chain type 2, putative [Plasmodium malariae]